MKKLLFVLIFAFVVNVHSQVLLSQNFDTALGWTVSHSTGASTLAGWSRVTAGTYPTCAPSAGAGMAKFNSYDVLAGNSYELTSPAITFAGQFYNVNYSMYRDDAYPSSLDNLKVYYNSTPSLTGATLLKTTFRSSATAPTVASNGWYNYSANVPYGVTGTGYIILQGNSEYGNNIYLDSVSVEQNAVVNDAALNDFDLNSVVSLGNYSITGSLTNNGSNPITTLSIGWQAGSGALNTQTFSGLNIIPGTTYFYTISMPWNATTTGATTMTVTISSTNSGDTNATNNSLSRSVYVVNEVFPKTVVYEEGTGTWCGWCVRGHVGLKDMAHNHPVSEFIGIAVHNADPMVVAAYDSAIGASISGYPSGLINRVPGEVDPGLDTLEPAYQAEVLKAPLAKINVPDVNWNPTTRAITFTATTNFALDLTNANYRMAAIIIQNGVTGTASGYGQRNYYSGGANGPLIDWEGINWSNYAATIPAATMVYNHVGRALVGGFTGVAGSVPTSVTYNTPYNYAFTHTLPTTQNVNNVEVVALILDATSGQIVNANNFDLGAKIALATNTFSTNAKFSVYPNPANNELRIKATETVSLSVIDILGKVVYSNNQVNNETIIDVSNLQKGVYLVKVMGENVYSTEKLIIE